MGALEDAFEAPEGEIRVETLAFLGPLAEEGLIADLQPRAADV